MAKSYTLSAKNFQSWREFTLPMTGFTVIIGPSDRGKSAIIRSLRGVLRNQVGANHITFGEKETSVSLDKIKMSRNNKTTVYTVGDEEFSKLAGGVPPIVEAMKFGEVEVNGVKLDPIFAGQFDSQFMLDLSPAELNSIFGLFSSTEKLNTGKKNAASRNLEFNATAKFLALEIQEAEAKSGRLADLNDEIEGASQGIFKLEDAYNSFLTSLNLLMEIQKNKKKCTFLQKLTQFSTPTTDDLVDTLSVGRGLMQYSKKKKNLDIIRASVQADIPSSTKLDTQFQNVLKLIRVQKLLQRLKLYRNLPSEPIEHKLGDILLSINRLNSFGKIDKNIEELKLKVQLSNKQVEEAAQKLDELQGHSIQCPKCGHFFSGEKHGHE